MTSSSVIQATLFSDPACPWGYSENPALRVIEWRYQDQIDWKLVLVGLSENTDRYAAHGYTPARMALSGVSFRDRYGMPFAPNPKARLSASARACRAVIAARREWPGREWATFRTLQLANFNTPLLFDEDEQLRDVLRDVPGIDADRIVSLIDDEQVLAEYAADKAMTRTAEGSPTDFQGKAGNSDGRIRYTAPSVIFKHREGRTLEAGGFQPVEAYDVIVANLDPTLERQAPPEGPAELLTHFELGLSTQEVAAILAKGNDRPDRIATEQALIELVQEGRAERHALGGDAIWTVAGGPTPPRLEAALATAGA
jgi:protein-disulfide isomerase-like protein with CxxC motif